jgi:hypothetical protein
MRVSTLTAFAYILVCLPVFERRVQGIEMEYDHLTTRTLVFPNDHSIGRIYTKTFNKEEGEWDFFGKAQGKVVIPQKNKARLEVNDDITSNDLSNHTSHDGIQSLKYSTNSHVFPDIIPIYIIRGTRSGFPDRRECQSRIITNKTPATSKAIKNQ